MDLLSRKNIKFTEYNIEKDVTKREEMLKKSNGATTVPEAKKSRSPNKAKIIIIRHSQNFFLTFKKLNISIKKFII